MTPKDVIMLFKLIVVLFPQSAKNYAEADEFARDAWFEMVKDLPAPLVAEAIKSYASSHVRPLLPRSVAKS